MDACIQLYNELSVPGRGIALPCRPHVINVFYTKLRGNAEGARSGAVRAIYGQVKLRLSTIDLFPLCIHSFSLERSYVVCMVFACARVTHVRDVDVQHVWEAPCNICV